MDYAGADDDTLRWIADAACADTPVDRFFVDAGRVIDEEILTLCTGCPVRRECLRYAYQRNYTSGYFGGFSPGQRKTLPLHVAETMIDAAGAKPAGA